MRNMLDIIEDLLRYRGIKLCRLDGETDGATRQMEIDRFMNNVSFCGRASVTVLADEFPTL